jgi:prolyl oligopeptidase
MQAQNAKLKYPVAKKVDQVDDFFGTKISDPYRWLENTQSAETKEWIKAENKLTQYYLYKIPFRNKIRKRLTELWNYEKFTAPVKAGDLYLYSKNNGLQEQNVLYIQNGLTGTPEIFLDPNKLSNDGSVSLGEWEFSKDYKYFSYGISRGGSDWREFYVIDVQSKQLTKDTIKWAKFTTTPWYKDGFYYSAYDKPSSGQELKTINEFQKLYYHKLGTTQSQDKLILQDKNNPKLGFGAMVTDDEHYLIISLWEGSASANRIWCKDLSADGDFIKVFDKAEANYSFVDNIGDKLLITTDLDAPKSKLILVDPNNPSKENWKTIIPESKDVMQSVSFIDGKLIVTYMKDAANVVLVYDQDGKYLYDIHLPTLGTVTGFSGKKTDKETFYTFTSFTYPATIYKYDIGNNKSDLFRKSAVKFDMDAYETKELFYTSKDSTKVPLFVVYKKGIKLDGNNPTLLYAYGGFNIAIQPGFSISRIPLLENGVVYALACIRGGNEYGEEWHKAGMFGKKQNVFDDFISAEEYLINNKYTNPEKLAIQGGSNGGLLIGAVINQRPELCKVAFPMVGVMDMLRYQKFTIGWSWVPEFGSSDNEDQFKYLIKYSPLHNIKKGMMYPAVMATTADHDDRVVPGHSFKYAATLQEMNGSNNPTLIRIETQVGHGAGTSTSKAIELSADMWSFMFYNMNVLPKY